MVWIAVALGGAAACDQGARATPLPANAGSGSAAPDPSARPAADRPVAAADRPAISPADVAAAGPPGACLARPRTALLPPRADWPPFAFRDGATVRTGPFWYCLNPKQIVVVDPAGGDRMNPPAHGRQRWTGDVVSISRRDPSTIARAPVSGSSSCHDRCDNGHGGYAGCEGFIHCALHSTLPDARTIEIDELSDRPLQQVDYAVRTRACGVDSLDADEVIAVCATQHYTVEVHTEWCNAMTGERMSAEVDDDVNQPEPHAPLRIEGRAPIHHGSTWSYTFANPDATLTFHLGTSPSATFTFRRATEDCLAFGLGQDASYYEKPPSWARPRSPNP